MIKDINTKLTDFSEKFNELSSKYDTIFSKLQPCKSDNFHRLTMIMQLECNSVTNGQWSRRDITEIILVSPEMHEDVLEKNVCKSLIGLMLFMKILHTFHCTNRSVRKIIKFKYRKQKQSLMYKRKIYSLNLMVFWNVWEEFYFAKACYVKISSFHINVNNSRVVKRYDLPGSSTTLQTLNWRNLEGYIEYIMPPTFWESLGNRQFWEVHW